MVPDRSPWLFAAVMPLLAAQTFRVGCDCGGRTAAPPCIGAECVAPADDGGEDAGLLAEDAGTDAGLPDDGGTDAGLSADGGADAGPPDDGGADAGLPDDGGADSGLPDDGGGDAGLPDDGGTDAGPPDDAGTDAGPPNDAGFDAGSLGPFDITGVTGNADVTADDWLATTVHPTANWTASTGASTYDVVIRDAADTTNVCGPLGTSATSFDFAGCSLVDGTTYLVRVTAHATGEARTATNDGFAFTVDTTPPGAFSITGATGNLDVTADAWLATTLVPTANWNAAAGASSYDVVIRSAADTVDVCAVQTISTPSFQFAGCTLVDGLAYRIRVIATDALGNATLATNDGFVFTVDDSPPAAFAITGATGGLDVTADAWLGMTLYPTANWGAAAGAASYDVVIRNAADTADACPMQTTASGLYDFSACALTDATTYLIKVTATDALGNLGPASNDGFSFTVDDSPPAAPVFSAPGSSTVVFTPGFTCAWTASDSGSGLKASGTYLVEQFSGAGCAGSPTSSGTQTAASFGLTGMAPGAAYSVRVTAYDGVGNVSSTTCSPSVTRAGAPTLTLSDPVTSSETVASNQTVDAALGGDSIAAQWCLSETQPTAPATGAAPCTGGGGAANGWYTARPTTFTLSLGDSNKTVWLWLADAAGNVSSSGASAAIDLRLGDIWLTYAVSPGNELRSRSWNATTRLWTAAAVEPVALSGGVRFLISRLAANRNLVGALSSTGTTGVLSMLESFQAPWATAFTSSAIADANTVRRGYDIAVEAVSKDVLVVYSDNGNSPKYRTFTTSWSGEASVFSTPPGAGVVEWVDLVERPGSNEITLLYADSGGVLFSVVWNGSAWATAQVQTLETTLTTLNWQTFGGAYERLSGNLLAVWSHPGAGALGFTWAVKSAASNTFGAPTEHTMMTRPGPLSIAAEPGTNRIAVAYDELTCGGGSCDDFYAAVWDGATWSYPPSPLNPDITAYYFSRTGSMPVAVGWVGTTGTAVAVYSQPAAAVSWARWTAGTGFVLQTSAAVNPAWAEQASFQLVSPAGSPVLLLLASDVSGALWAKSYDGATWANTEGGAALDTTLSNLTGVPFSAVAR